MVYCSLYDLWVHEGVSGLWDCGVQDEMAQTQYYHIGPGPYDVIVDVGAHIGCFALFAASVARLVVAIEPHPSNVELLKKNLEHRGIKNVIVIEGVVTYDEGVELRTFAPGSNSGGSQLIRRGDKTFENSTKHEGVLSVQATTLETIMRWQGIDEISCLKLDCEGSEYSILSKADLTKVKFIVGEWHHVPGRPKFDEFCRDVLPNWALDSRGYDGPLERFTLLKKM